MKMKDWKGKPRKIKWKPKIRPVKWRELKCCGENS